MQVVLLAVMAQLGCHVPAEAATVRIPDKVLARVSNRDSIEGNSSTFRTEMEETAFILNNIGPTSMVIIDELGRGTSVDEGFAICYAVAERLLTGSSGFIFLATHFRQMTRLAELHPCAANHHFLSETGSSTHRLVPGKAPDSDLQYGIAVPPSGSVLTDPGPLNGPFCFFGSVLGLFLVQKVRLFVKIVF